jgi:hypothetical protein
VDVGHDRQVVGQLNLHPVAHVELEHRTGHGAVAGPRLDDLARRDLPVGDGGGEFEPLGAVGQDLELEGRLPRPSVAAGKSANDASIFSSRAAPCSGVISS